MAPETPSPLPSPGRRRIWLAVAAGVCALAVLVGARLLNRGERLTHFTAKVQRGEIRDVVDATGTVNAVITVQLGRRSPEPSRSSMPISTPTSRRATSSR